eukprot:Skav211040  [mRNA]  locus=scaffold1434:202982:207784:- [translate_table: standard]
MKPPEEPAQAPVDDEESKGSEGKNSMPVSAMVSERSASEMEPDALPRRVVSSIPELDKRCGPYIIFDQDPERGRAESSCISLLALLGKHFDTFTAPQQARGKLLQRQWQELLEIVEWISPTQDQVHGVLVLLAIRGIVKAKATGSWTAVTRQIPKQHRRPERAITFLMECHWAPGS